MLARQQEEMDAKNAQIQKLLGDDKAKAQQALEAERAAMLLVPPCPPPPLRPVQLAAGWMGGWTRVQTDTYRDWPGPAGHAPPPLTQTLPCMRLLDTRSAMPVRCCHRATPIRAKAHSHTHTRARARSLSCIPSTHADIRWTRAQESFYGRPVEIADREMVEGEADSIYRGADESDVALLIVGDPFW